MDRWKKTFLGPLPEVQQQLIFKDLAKLIAKVQKKTRTLSYTDPSSLYESDWVKNVGSGLLVGQQLVGLGLYLIVHACNRLSVVGRILLNFCTA